MIKLAAITAAALAALIGGAYAADLQMPVQEAPAAMAPSATSWDGPYIGANIGYGWGTATSDNFSFEATTISLSGWSVGGQIGYNYTLGDNIVIGVEGDLNWDSQDGTTLFPIETYEGTSHINWTGAVTGHVGYAFDTFMPYILAGVAFANNTVSYNNTGPTSFISSETNTHTGYTVGVGLAAMLAPSVSAFAEYRYSDYGSRDYNTEDTAGVGLTDNSVRVGVNYHF